MTSATASYAVDSSRPPRSGTLRLAVTLCAIGAAYVALAWDNISAIFPWS